VCDVVDQMLFKHEAPVTNRVEKRLFEGPGVDAEPVLKQNDAVERVNLAVQLLVRVNLHSTVVHALLVASTRNSAIAE